MIIKEKRGLKMLYIYEFIGGKYNNQYLTYSEILKIWNGEFSKKLGRRKVYGIFSERN